MCTFKLSIQIYDYAIGYHCNYSPPLKNIGGYFGSVYPDGGLFGKSFDELLSLGNGTHEVQLDERQQTPHGTAPELDNARKLFESYRLALFGYEHGVFTEADILAHALLAYSEEYADDICKLAPDFLLASLREFASRIPENLEDRSPDEFVIFSSAGTTQIPSANLNLLRRTFGRIAG